MSENKNRFQKRMNKDPVQDYCGCCGNEISQVGIWCSKCRKHVIYDTRPPWDRTYQAQYNKPCPYQIKIG